ncbi:hypothetical protein DPMN_025250 [Dreissena polymorpha]|uniref:Uncharacterized protein n=1 Tax=Dreissena polymorpha TaxID=45954 RepID=A0A9D4LR23_DREPO|nr:hypothetical protein DPMN_025250 [Dreissena polymorpha]
MKVKYFPNSSVDAHFDPCDNSSKTSPEYQQYKKMQQQSANWIMFYNLAECVPQVFMNIVLTAYTDSLEEGF